MDKKGLVLALVVLIQACGPLLAQTKEPDPPGVMQRLAERAREAKDKVQRIGEAALGFAGAYYEDHVQPVAVSYYEWASTWRSSLWERMQNKMSSYVPFGVSEN